MVGHYANTFVQLVEDVLLVVGHEHSGLNGAVHFGGNFREVLELLKVGVSFFLFGCVLSE